ncbi:MAG: YARHG domain-containing protein [Chthoniobacteraceae bacterium]
MLNPASNHHFRFFAFWVFGLILLSIVWSDCLAAEQPIAKRHSLTDVISIILKGELLVGDDLGQLTLSELQLARNAVFARHGRPLNRNGIGDYFYRRSWYRMDKGFPEEQLTPNDHENIARIQNAERGVPPRPDNRTIEGAMRLYLDAFFWANSDAFLALCHPKHPPYFTAYTIGTLRRSGSTEMKLKDMKANFAAKGVQWTDYFGDAGGAAQYRWTVLGTTLEDWKQDGDIFRLPPRDDPNPKAKNAIYVRWQKIEGRYYIAEFSDILC